MAFDTKVFATRDYAAKEIAVGVLTLDDWGICYYVDGEGSAADDLATINTGIESQLIIIKANGVTLTLKHGTGNISLSSGADFALTAEKQIALIYDGANWLDLVGSQADAFVTKALFDAHTVLAATADNTPAALGVTEQTVVGRITGGNIAALTVAQLVALALSATLPENIAVEIEELLSADGKYSGLVCNGVMGTNVVFGDLIYLNNDDGRWELADADAEITTKPQLGIALETGADGDTKKVLLWGYIREDDWTWTTVGYPLFVSTTDGDMTETAPSGAADCIRIVGHVKSADSIFFNPSPDWFERA